MYPPSPLSLKTPHPPSAWSQAPASQCVFAHLPRPLLAHPRHLQESADGQWSYGRRLPKNATGIGEAFRDVVHEDDRVTSGWFPSDCLGHDHPFLTTMEWWALEEINHARTDPGRYAERVERQMECLDEDNVLWLPGRTKGLRSKEGRRVYEEAAAFLRQLAASVESGDAEPLSRLSASYGMTLAARDHAADTGAKRMTGHGT